jgi:hypothetical protein
MRAKVTFVRGIAGIHVGNARFDVTTHTQPVRQHVRARMPQQCEDTPDRQHDETDKTHGRILTGQFADGKPETVPGRIGMAPFIILTHTPDFRRNLGKSEKIRKIGP